VAKCKIVEGKCGPRELCWSRAGKIKSNRAVTSAFGIKVAVAKVPRKFVARTECLDARGRLKKGFRFVDGRCKRVGTPGMRGARK
jgi:hypothetical protein